MSLLEGAYCPDCPLELLTAFFIGLEGVSLVDAILADVELAPPPPPPPIKPPISQLAVLLAMEDALLEAEEPLGVDDDVPFSPSFFIDCLLLL